MTDAQVLPAQETRVETGPLRFGDDWTGVFIRGDDAFGVAMALEEYLATKSLISRTAVEAMVKLLRSCEESPRPTTSEDAGNG